MTNIITKEPTVPEAQHPEHAEKYRNLVENVRDVNVYRDDKEIRDIDEIEIREEINGAGLHVVLTVGEENKSFLHDWREGEIVFEFVFEDYGWFMTRTLRAADIDKGDEFTQMIYVFWETDD